LFPYTTLFRSVRARRRRCRGARRRGCRGSSPRASARRGAAPPPRRAGSTRRRRRGTSPRRSRAAWRAAGPRREPAGSRGRRSGRGNASRDEDTSSPRQARRRCRRGVDILAPMGPPAHGRHAGLLRAALAVAALLASTAWAQVSVPTFGTRGDVDEAVLSAFMAAFRSAVGAATGLEVRAGERITPGIAGSLDPGLTMLVAEIDATRYAVRREGARVSDGGGHEYTVNLIVVDSQVERATDVISAALDPAAAASAAGDLAAVVAEFTPAVLELLQGDAGLFVSSEPGDAQVFVDGVSIGRTGQLDVAMLRPGRYQVELRKEGFLPEVRMVELRSGDTSFLHVILT